MVSNPDLKKMESIVEWLKAVPYEVLRKGQLYNAEELYRGYEPSEDVEKDKASFADCYDSRVYRHFMEQDMKPLMVSLYRRRHIVKLS